MNTTKITMPVTAATAFEAFRSGHLSPNCLRGVVGYSGYHNPNESADVVAAAAGKAQLFRICHTTLCSFTVTLEVPVLAAGAHLHMAKTDGKRMMVDHTAPRMMSVFMSTASKESITYAGVISICIHCTPTSSVALQNLVIRSVYEDNLTPAENQHFDEMNESLNQIHRRLLVYSDSWETSV